MAATASHQTPIPLLQHSRCPKKREEKSLKELGEKRFELKFPARALLSCCCQPSRGLLCGFIYNTCELERGNFGGTGPKNRKSIHFSMPGRQRSSPTTKIEQNGNGRVYCFARAVREKLRVLFALQTLANLSHCPRQT